MPEQLQLQVNPDPITRLGQELLYFPDAIPEITAQLADEFMHRHQSASSAPELIETKAKRDVMRIFIGVVATVVYADLAEHLVPHIKENRPLVTEQLPRTPLYMSGGLPKYNGYADEFARTGMAWLFGAGGRVFGRAEDPENRYHPLIKALNESTRDAFTFAAENPSKRVPQFQNVPHIQDRLYKAARHAPTNFGYSNLLDNVKVSLEILLHFGLAYSREEGVLPEGSELTTAALANVSMLGRAATIGSTPFSTMVHKNPLATTFHQYDMSELDDPEELYPSRESIFTRKEGAYTFRYPPIAKGPKKAARNCPARRAWRPPEARGQDAIEEFFACIEERGCNVIARPGDGTFQSAIAALGFGSFIGGETIYAAWPTQERLRSG